MKQNRFKTHCHIIAKTEVDAVTMLQKVEKVKLKVTEDIVAMIEQHLPLNVRVGEQFSHVQADVVVLTHEALIGMITDAFEQGRATSPERYKDDIRQVLNNVSSKTEWVRANDANS